MKNINATPRVAKPVLEQLAKGKAMTTKELSLATNMPKSTIYTNIIIMVDKGEVVQGEARKGKIKVMVFSLPSNKLEGHET